MDKLLIINVLMLVRASSLVRQWMTIGYVETAAPGCPAEQRSATVSWQRPVELRSASQPRAAVSTWSLLASAFQPLEDGCSCGNSGQRQG